MYLNERVIAATAKELARAEGELYNKEELANKFLLALKNTCNPKILEGIHRSNIAEIRENRRAIERALADQPPPPPRRNIADIYRSLQERYKTKE